MPIKLPRKLGILYVAILTLVIMSGVTAPQGLGDGEEYNMGTYHSYRAEATAKAGNDLRYSGFVNPSREGLIAGQGGTHYLEDMVAAAFIGINAELMPLISEIEMAPEPEYVIHVVSKGENLSRISSLYGLSYQEVAIYNDIMDPNIIFVDQELKIPLDEAVRERLAVRTLASRQAVAPSERDTQLLAKVIHWEARGESYSGKVAVGAVVLNRIKSSKFPNTLRAVIYQPKQFSGADTTAFANIKPDSSSLDAAKEALRGSDPTNSALYFLNQDKVIARRGGLPSWLQRLSFTVKIGNHWFYK